MGTSQPRTPGVYLEQQVRQPAPQLVTGVPAFLGVLSGDASAVALVPFVGGDGQPVDFPRLARLDYAAWSQLEARLGVAWGVGFLGFAVRGFFENGGERCYVVALKDDSLAALDAGLALLAGVDDFDLVCAPETAGVVAGQERLTAFCDTHPGCFAILDAAGSRTPSPDITLATLAGSVDMMIRTPNAALYGPWIKVRGACAVCSGTGIAGGATCTTCWGTGQGFVPPCGHIAGIYARTDRATGPQKAPANEPLTGVADLQVMVRDADQAALNTKGINCLRAFPGRGIRIWGARTTSQEQAWIYVNVRRLFLTVSRWLELNLAGAAFEPNDIKLWLRIEREVGAFLEELFQQGAFQGETATEAYYVKCDAETNPPAVRDAGQVVAEVGLAPARPNEFIVARLIAGASGVSVTNPLGAEGAPAPPAGGGA